MTRVTGAGGRDAELALFFLPVSARSSPWEDALSRRSQIAMTDAEVVEFIAARHSVALATLKRDGQPHLVPMWFLPEGTSIELWSFAKAQKAVNLRRDPRATLLLETGRSYDELRGVSLECDVQLLEEREEVERIGVGLGRRYSGAPEEFDEVAAREALRHQVAKRVGFRFTPTRVVSWDHRKLGGAY